jgi:predicted RNase H-like nuclease (RuvC/YqgF family)
MATETDEARQLAALRAQREELSRELVRKSYRIGELEQEMAEVGRRYEATLSWRLTRPVRALKPMLKRLLR